MIKRILTLTLDIFSLSFFLFFLGSQINQLADNSANVVNSVAINSTTTNDTSTETLKKFKFISLTQDLSLKSNG